MSAFHCINTTQLLKLKNQYPSLQLVDIRDPSSFNQHHIEQSINLTNDNIHDFIRNADLDAPLVVVCYHGHSSQQAALYLHNQGFKTVYSLDGGFEAWSTLKK